MTDHKRAEAYRMELAAEQERTAFLQEFIRKMSHDCRTPLSIINTNLYFLERTTDSDHQKRYLEAIRSQTSQLETFVQNILEVSRLESNPELAYQAIDINQLFREIANDFYASAKQKNISIMLDLNNALPLISADKAELKHALVNLVENAVRYTPTGGSISLETNVQSNHVCIAVHDTGIGISSEELPLIFDHFYRTTTAQQMDSDGTGLGLAIVRQIVTLHGGSLEVESTPGQGSLFRIRLPI
jgi:signal transduction histidine kinase